MDRKNQLILREENGMLLGDGPSIESLVNGTEDNNRPVDPARLIKKGLNSLPGLAAIEPVFVTVSELRGDAERFAVTETPGVGYSPNPEPGTTWGSTSFLRNVS